VAECPELQFALDRTRLLGAVAGGAGAYCWNLGVGQFPFNAGLKEVCESFFVEPVPGTGEYEYDCSVGCTPCVYREMPAGSGLYKCAGGATVTGCP
jgi:hypothetical protein